ncbi:MAG: HDOD domain-containing protein [Gammaproteobacteria bacterium]|nr:HDOD domain-containing protein [Gammaproteobacteria bacterium]
MQSRLSSSSPHQHRAVTVDGQELSTLLGTLEPFAHFDKDDLLVLASRSELFGLKAKGVLFELGDSDPWMYFVVEGTVRLVAADGRARVVDGGTRAARQPLAQLQPRHYRAVAATAVTCLRVDVSGLGRLEPVDRASQYVVEEVSHHGEGASGGLVGRYQALLDKGDFRLPSLPHIAMDAVRAIDRDEADPRDLAAILINDPPITAKLIRAANSPLFHGLTSVNDCDKAIVRLGMKTARQLIVAFAMGELFKATNPAVRRRLEALWQHSTQVAAIAMVLSRELRCLEPEEAMVAGLLHDIGGVPIYNLAADDPELAADDAILDELVTGRRGELGARLLADWNFPDTLVTAAREAEDWWRDPAPAPDYADLVIVAQLHAWMGRPDAPDVPPMVQLPAFRKVTARRGLDPETSLAVLAEARGRIEEARSLLAG